MRIASSMVRNVMTGETGPKVSCFTSNISGCTRSSSVGE